MSTRFLLFALRSFAFFVGTFLTFVPSSEANVFVPIDSTYKLTFDEEFNGSTLDSTKWNTGWYENSAGLSGPVNSIETCGYNRKNVTFDGNNMILNATNDAVTVNGKTYPCTSANVDTFDKFNQAFGYVEARIFVSGAVDGTIHNWPAFWMVGRNWPVDGEIDVLEGIDGGTPQYHFHSSGCSPGGIAEGNFVGWHVFAALWEPGSVKFYYDGKIVGTISGSVVTSAPQSIVLTLAMGGIGGPFVVPSLMKVDYVHMYSNSAKAVAVIPQAGYGGPGDDGSGGSQPGPSPTSTPTATPAATPRPTATPVPTPNPTATPLSSAPNLVLNPGFESGFQNYSYFGNTSLLSTGVHSGSRAVAIGPAAGIQQTVSNLKPNTTYTLSGFVRADSGTVMIGAKQFGANQIVQPSTAKDYVPLRLTFKTGKKNKAAVIFCYTQSGLGACDDLRLSLGGN